MACSSAYGSGGAIALRSGKHSFLQLSQSAIIFGNLHFSTIFPKKIKLFFAIIFGNLYFSTIFPKKMLHISKNICTFAPVILKVYNHVDWKTRRVNAFASTIKI